MSHLASRFSRHGGALLVALALGAALPVWAQPAGMPSRDGAAQAQAGWHGGRSPEAAARRVDRMLDGLNVGEAERARIRQIVLAAATDLAGQRAAGRQLHAQAMRIFAAPVVDAAAAEQVRQQMLAQHDRMTRRRLQAMLEVSAVLTPEQRAAALQRMQQRGGPGMHREMHRQHHGEAPGQPRP